MKDKESPMALTQGAYQEYDFNRMVVLFTMMNGDAEVRCAVSTGALDDLDRPFKATSAEREAQFLKLRGRIEARIAQKFLQGSFEGKRSEIILRSIDF
jgi:Protein of unknown function (DUF1488)